MRPAIAILTLLAVPASAQSPVHTLTLDEALTLARAHQPQLRQARATSDAAQARADQARAPLLPQVDGAASYQRSTTNYVARPGALPGNIAGQGGATSSWSTIGFYNVGLSASQLLWDFGGSTSRWRAARATAASDRDSELATALQVAANLRGAFFQARAAKAFEAVAVETLANQDRHLEQVQAFVEVGTKPEIDLAQSRADRANALLQLINAQNGYETAKAQLNQAMGVEGRTDYDVSDETLAPVLGEEKDTDSLLAEALATRPEMAATVEALRAQELTVRAFRADYWPSISATTSLTDAGGQADNLTWNWSASLNVTVPVFRGGLPAAQVREARSNLQGLRAQADTLRQQIRLEVDQARLTVRAAKAALDAAGDVLVNAKELLRLAEGRYEAGVGNIIELGDAQVAHTSAAQQKVQAEYKLASARAQLLQAIGRS